MGNLRLSLAFGDNPRARPVTDGRITAEGIDFTYTSCSMPELAYRQFHDHAFDVSELSLSSQIAARSRGDDAFVGVPIFCTRRYWQTNILVRDDAGIETPEQLAGKRIGVPEYQQTAALWARGILQHEFGVDPMSCHWFMERLPELSHGGATGFHPPAGLDFHYIPAETNIGQMLQAGQLDATLLYISTPNLVDRSSITFGEGSGVRRLFEEPSAEGARYFQKTGLYPANHGVVVRRELVERNPWVPMNVYQAFCEAKELWAASMRASIQPYIETGLLERSVADVDMFPYGTRANRDMLETLCDYSFEQGLSDRRVAVEELFYGPSLLL